MKKPILLIISNNSYFQPSFLNNVCRVISKTNYYVERVLVLNTALPKSDGNGTVPILI